MAIDLIRGGRIPNRGFKPTKSTNAYLKTLIKVSSSLNLAICFHEPQNNSQIQ